MIQLHQPEPEKKPCSTITICQRCRTEVGRGKPHTCTEAQAVKNLTKEALDLGSSFGDPLSKSYQRVSSNLLKVAEKEEDVSRGEKFSLATGINA